MQVASVVLAVLLVAWSVLLQGCGKDSAGFSCESTLRLPTVAEPLQKGLDLDDTTFRSCSGKIPSLWPHTDVPVTSLRLFKPWDASWSKDDREKAWQELDTFVRRNGAKILLGAQVSCKEEDDDAEWALNLQLLRRLGPKHIMGLAVGNEMELLQWKGKAGNVTQECMDRLWVGGRFWEKTKEFVAAMDMLDEGFKQVPVTSVFGGFALNGEPWVEMPTAMVGSYFHNATAFFGERWVFTFNIYPYFNPANRLDPGSSDQCEQAIAGSACYGRECNVPATAAIARRKMMQMGESIGEYRMWLGETGWSWPMSDTLPGANQWMAKCSRFSSEPVFRTVYDGFLKWNMSIEGIKPPEHIFWFTIRDSSNFNIKEHFGLVADCDASRCKMQADVPNESAAFVV